MSLFFWKKNNTEAEDLRRNSKGDFVESVFKKVSLEIESLRKYDRGEKKIDAPNIRNLVRNIHSSSK